MPIYMQYNFQIHYTIYIYIYLIYCYYVKMFWEDCFLDPHFSHIPCHVHPPHALHLNYCYHEPVSHLWPCKIWCHPLALPHTKSKQHHGCPRSNHSHWRVQVNPLWYHIKNITCNLERNKIKIQAIKPYNNNTNINMENPQREKPPIIDLLL